MVLQELLVSRPCVILFCLNELIGDIKIALLPGLYVPCCKQGVGQQVVHLIRIVEIIASARR